MTKYIKWTQEEIDNFTGLVNLLIQLEEEQKHMTEEEKQNNAIKMQTEQGDIYY